MNYLKEKLKFLISSVKKIVGVLTTVTGSSPLDLPNSSGEDLDSYIVYGKTIQDGTPTTTSPIEIQSIGVKTDNILVNNLSAGTKGTIAGINYVVNDDLSVSLQGTTTGRFSLRLAGKWANTESVVTLEPNNYTLSGQLSNFYVSTYLKTTSGETPSGYANTRVKNHYNFSVTETKEIGDIFLYCNVTGTTVDGVIYPSLVVGTYDEVEYEPYNKYKIPVSVTRKNLCNNIFVNTLINYANGIEATNNNSRSIRDYIEIDANLPLTIYRNLAPIALGLRFYNSNKNYLGSIGTSEQLYTVTPATYSAKFSTAKYLKWSIVSTLDIKYICVQSDSIVGNYDDYLIGTNYKMILNSPINSISTSLGTYTDYIDFEAKKVYRNCGMHVWSKDDTLTSSLATGKYRFYSKIDNHLASTRFNVFCNRGTFGLNHDIGTSFAFSVYLYYYPPIGITDVDSFKTWLANNYLYMIYPLSTQVEEDMFYCPTLKTYEGDTEIGIGTDLAPDVEVKYYKN